MAKTPQQPAEVFGPFIDDCKNVFGDTLLSIILYGSGARSDYRPKKSDINFAVVVTSEGLSQLKKVVSYLKSWKKKSISMPLFLTPYYIENSLDSFPVEFLDFKLNHLLVYGEDYFKNLQIKHSDLRLQIEKEIKGKLIHLRQNFLTSGLQPKVMQRILIQTLPTFKVIFEALLHLKNEKIPNKLSDVYEKIAELFKLDKDVFKSVVKLKYNQTKLSKDQLVELFEKYIEAIRNVSIEVDKMM